VSHGVYLDHAATAFPKAPGVAEAMADFLRDSAGNPGRGGHRLTVAASREIEGARGSVAELLGSEPERTLLGAGATYWLNVLFDSLLGEGDRVVASALEHNAVMRPLRGLERRRAVRVDVVAGDHPWGVPTAAEFAASVRGEPTRLAVVTHASNVTGAVLPIGEIAAAISPVPLVVDGAQTAGAVPFEFDGSGASAYVASAHKGLLGPAGVGLLLLAPGFEPAGWMRGGTGSRSESHEMPEFLPDRLEPGTPNGPGIAGLGAAAAWLSQRGVAEIAREAGALVDRLVDGVSELHGVRLHGYEAGAPRTGVVSLTLDGVDTGELAAWLDRERGLMLRAGLHCSPAAHRRIGTFPSGTLRVGFGPFNDASEVDALLKGLAHITP
jgi:selenocysteine lyase/cysteine desulfurase